MLVEGGGYGFGALRIGSNDWIQTVEILDVLRFGTNSGWSALILASEQLSCYEIRKIKI